MFSPGDCEKLEKEYRWLDAANGWAELSKSQPPTEPEHARLNERSALALYKASMQSETPKDFQQLIQESLASYQLAARSFETIVPQDQLSSLRCQAMIYYLQFWQAKSMEERKKLVDASWDTACDLLDALAIQGRKVEYGATYNSLCWTSMYGATVSPTSPMRDRRMSKAIENGERAAAFFSDIGDTAGFARACSYTALLCEGYGYFLVAAGEQRDRLRAKATEYWRKALEASETVALESWVTLALISAIWVGWRPGSKIIIDKLQDLLETSRRSRDRFLEASILNWLAFNYVWAFHPTKGSEAAHLGQSAVLYWTKADEKFRIFGVRSLLQNPESIISVELGETEIDIVKKRTLLEKAVAVSTMELDKMRTYDNPVGVYYSEHNLGKALMMLASTIEDPVRRRKLYDDALSTYQWIVQFTCDYCPDADFEMGMAENRVAQVRCKIAEILVDPIDRKEMLQNAIAGLRRGLASVAKVLPYEERTGPVAIFGTVGAWQAELGEILMRVYEDSRDVQLVEEAIDTFDASIHSLQKLGNGTQIAEVYWSRANASAVLANYSEASEYYLAASKTYQALAKETPELADFHNDYAAYMQAWAEIENAIYNHDQQENSQSEEHYRNAAKVLASTRRWSNLSINYSGLALIERAERVSRENNIHEAINALEEATDLFDSLLRVVGPESVWDPRIRLTISNLRKSAERSKQYCMARILFENGRLLGKKGQHTASAQKFGKAASAFEKIGPAIPSNSGAEEIRALATASRAYKSMAEAEAAGSSERFAEASELFTAAGQVSSGPAISSLMEAHGHFCKALSKANEFVVHSSENARKEANDNFELAANYYAKIGLTLDSEYAEASKLFFDGYSVMLSAHRENDSAEKAKAYATAERILLSSAHLYTKTGFTAKTSEVLRLVEKVSNEKTLALSITDMLAPKAFFSSSLPQLTDSVVPDRPENATIEATVKIPDDSSNSAGSIETIVSLANLGNSKVRLLGLDGLVSNNFKLDSSPPEFQLRDSTLGLDGRFLKPKESFHLKMFLRPASAGVLTLKPTLVFADAEGQVTRLQLQPVDVALSPIASFLIRSFAEDYLSKNLSKDYSGWRSLMEISDQLKVPRSRLYGDPRYGHIFSKTLEALIASRVVEHRTFPGERGRGGNIIKLRASYENEAVRRLVHKTTLVPQAYVQAVRQPIEAV